jgi:hypothetical protein
MNYNTFKRAFNAKFLPYSSPFESYVKHNIRADFAKISYESLDLEHFYSFCEEIAERPYILQLKGSEIHRV